jgi:hypothetical protein
VKYRVKEFIQNFTEDAWMWAEFTAAVVILSVVLSIIF